MKIKSPMANHYSSKVFKDITMIVFLKETGVGGMTIEKVKIVWESNPGGDSLLSYVTTTLTIFTKVARICRV